MALSATIYKAELNVVDMDRHYYEQHSLTLAQHPSETAERLMLRLLVFALHASETMTFTKGLSTDDEPDLWRKVLAMKLSCGLSLACPVRNVLKKPVVDHSKWLFMPMALALPTCGGKRFSHSFRALKTLRLNALMRHPWSS